MTRDAASLLTTSKKYTLRFTKAPRAIPVRALVWPSVLNSRKTWGGHLELESEPGKGTTATCTIPCIVGDERLAAPSLAAVQDLLPTFDAKGQKAWIVEDSQPVSELLDDELTDMGFDVELAVTTEAFAQRASGSAPAIIVTDYQLPGASGDEVLRMARAQWPMVPVILLSAVQNSSLRAEESSPTRFSAYLSKPVDRLELRTTVAELCNLVPDA